MDNISNKIFIQLKNYIESNYKILKILKGDNVQKEWKEDLLYAISRGEIEQWQKEIGFKEISEELNKRGKIIITDKDKDWIKSLIQEKINKDIKINNINNLNNYYNLRKSMNNSSIYTSIYSSLRTIAKEKIYISSYCYFYLISKEAWESFDINEKEIYNGKILIKIGKNKIIIKSENNKIIILCLEEKNLNIINPYNLEKYLNEFIIVFESNKDFEPNEIIEEINKMDIQEFKKHIKDNGERCKFNYGKYNLNIIKKDKISSLNLNINEIPENNTELINEDKENEILKLFESESRSIKDVNYINKILIKKIKNSSYIIAGMYSLSQIPEFTEYFFCNKHNSFFKSELLYSFKEYIDILWKENINREIFEPKYFMRNLRNKDKITFDFKKEKEPIIFLEKIFDYINEELNDKDKEIEKEIKDSKYEFIPKYNSIVAKIFYGIFNNEYLCSLCGEKKNLSEKDIFKFIEININQYSNYQSKLDNSLTFFYLDDLIDFFFYNQDNLEEYQEKNEMNKNNSSYCNRCQKHSNNKLEKRIYKYPEILIIWINWGKFTVDEGFNDLDSNKLIFNKILDLSKFSSINNSDEIIYKVRSIINYPIMKEKIERDWKKFITFSRHLVDNKFYSYQPSGNVIQINNINRLRFVPSVLFYEKI